MTIEPRHAVAEFDSATAILSATAAALRGAPFPHLGQSARRAFPVRMSWLLPTSPRRAAYAILGGAEGVSPDQTGDVDMAAVAEWVVGHYDTGRRYPGVVIGSTNGAAVHLCGATGMPFLPQTLLIPVRRRKADPDRPDDAMEFGRRVAPPLLDRNPDVVLHHMHDGSQDRLMTRHMTYFRLKWCALPEAYRRFLADCLEPGAPVLLLADESTWPTTRVGDRHVFQAGAQGGLTAEEYIRGSTRLAQFLREDGSHYDRFQSPEPDGISAEAEWGYEPRLGKTVSEWAKENGHSVTYVRLPEPEALSHPVAQTMRRRIRDAGAAGDRLLVESFAMIDHAEAFRTGSTPYWSYFPVDASLQQAKTYLETMAAAGDPFHDVDVMLFPHGVSSVGATSPSEWAEQVLPHITGHVRFVSGTAQRWPGHFDALAKYGRALSRQPTRTRDVEPLAVDRALAGLSSDRVRVETDGQLHV